MATQSLVGALASHLEAACPESDDRPQHTAPVTPTQRWQNAGIKLAEKGSIRFDDAAASRSDDTAHCGPDSKSSEMERKPSLTARNSLNLSRFSRSFGGNTALAETVRLAQQQQQTNRQSAAPVLKAVPSTKVGVTLMSRKHACMHAVWSSSGSHVMCILQAFCRHLSSVTVDQVSRLSFGISA